MTKFNIFIAIMITLLAVAMFDFIIINWLLGCNTWDKSQWDEYNSCFNPFDLF